MKKETLEEFLARGGQIERAPTSDEVERALTAKVEMLGEADLKAAMAELDKYRRGGRTRKSRLNQLSAKPRGGK
jgi:hypothetical protein